MYGFDTLHTPTITAVSPTIGRANTQLTITGTDLGGAVTVLVGYDTCTAVSQTSTSITCTVPGNTASTVPVQVLFSDLGFASNTSVPDVHPHVGCHQPLTQRWLLRGW